LLQDKKTAAGLID